jgi:hypothetical protein
VPIVRGSTIDLVYYSSSSMPAVKNKDYKLDPYSELTAVAIEVMIRLFMINNNI